VSDVIWQGAEELRQHLVPLNDLVPFPENPLHESRAHDIVKSLRRYGQTRPILTWENAQEHGWPTNTIVGGHHVWLAAHDPEFGWTHVAVVASRFEDYETARDYLALDNILSQRNPEELGAQLALFSGVDDLDRRDDLRAMVEHSATLVDASQLKVSERSLRQDPEDLIEHIAASLREAGWQDEQVIVSRDGTILVGESVLRAAAVAGIDKIPVKRVEYDADSPEAARLIARHYAAGKRASVDDRAFAELLRQIHEDVGTLEGTGYDAESLGALLLMTRSAAEIRDASQAMEWIGLAEYVKTPLPVKLTISFDTEEEREQFMAQRMPEAIVRKRHLSQVSVWWPPRERDDPHSLRFVGTKPSDLEAVDVGA